MNMVFCMGRRFRVKDNAPHETKCTKCGVGLSAEEKEHCKDMCFDCYAKEDDGRYPHPDDPCQN